MATGRRHKPTPAEVNDELHALIDLELGHPRRRTTPDRQDRDDRDAVHEIATLLRNPHWDTALLDEICDIIRDTGRQVGAPPLAVLASRPDTDLTAAEIAQPCVYSQIYGGERWCDTHCSAAPCPFDVAASSD